MTIIITIVFIINFRARAIPIPIIQEGLIYTITESMLISHKCCICRKLDHSRLCGWDLKECVLEQLTTNQQEE